MHGVGLRFPYQLLSRGMRLKSGSELESASVHENEPQEILETRVRLTVKLSVNFIASC